MVRFYYLTQATYDDGSHAVYDNYEAGRVLPGNPWSVAAGKVKTCEDVRFAGAMRNIEYQYVPASQSESCDVAWGQIRAEKNMATRVAVSRVDYPCWPPPERSRRIETRADGATRIFQYGREVSPDLKSYTDFSYTNGHQTTVLGFTVPAPGNSNHYLRTVRNARGYATSTEKENSRGAVMAVIHPNLSRTKFAYSVPADPQYLISRTDENDKVTYYDRDGANRVWRIRYPDGGVETFTYDNNPFGLVHEHRLD